MADEPVTNVPYIGEKTAKTLRKKVRSFTNRGPIGDRLPTVSEVTAIPEGVLQQELGVRQRQELGKYTRDSEIYYLTREERSQLSSQRQQGSSEPSESVGVGDFVVNREARRDVYDEHQERSSRARDVDNQRRATITTDKSKWMQSPGRFDFPGVDTPRRKARLEEKDKPFVRPGDFRREPEDESQFGVSLPGFAGQAQPELFQEAPEMLPGGFERTETQTFGDSGRVVRFESETDFPGAETEFIDVQQIGSNFNLMSGFRGPEFDPEEDRNPVTSVKTPDELPSVFDAAARKAQETEETDSEPDADPFVGFSGQLSSEKERDDSEFRGPNQP